MILGRNEARCGRSHTRISVVSSGPGISCIPCLAEGYEVQWGRSGRAVTMPRSSRSSLSCRRTTRPALCIPCSTTSLQLSPQVVPASTTRGNHASCDSLVTPRQARTRPSNTKTGSELHKLQDARTKNLHTSRISNPLPQWSTQIHGWPLTSTLPPEKHCPGSEIWIHMDSGAPSRTRTDTVRILSPLPLPIGL